MATTAAEKVCRLKGDIPGYLETGEFTLLGWHHDNKEILFSRLAPSPLGMGRRYVFGRIDDWEQPLSVNNI
jgi:hypothetical protein